MLTPDFGFLVLFNELGTIFFRHCLTHKPLSFELNFRRLKFGNETEYGVRRKYMLERRMCENATECDVRLAAVHLESSLCQDIKH